MNHVLDIPVEVQERPHWCWAAVSTMAVKSFDDDAQLAQLKQFDTVVYARRQVRTKQDVVTKKQEIIDSSTLCTPPAMCDSTRDPWLFEVECRQVPPGKVLTRERLEAEIIGGRPVIVKWDYSDVDRGEEDLPFGQHYLIITGFNDVTKEFRVFDPWPVSDAESNEPDPNEPDPHAYDVTYEGYIDPQVSLGQRIFAVHKSDRYDLRRFASGELSGAPPDEDFATEPPRQEIVLTGVDFDEILRLENEIQAIARQSIVYRHDGTEVEGVRRAGMAFPIVALRTRELLHAGDAAQRLLTGKAASLVAPVVLESSGKVISSFQMFNNNGKWIEGGHSNTRITQLLVKAARHLQKEFGPDSVVYLLSIPEQVTFFAACLNGDAARVISLADGAKGPVLSAQKALSQLVDFIRTFPERQDDSDLRPGGPARPV